MDDLEAFKKTFAILEAEWIWLRTRREILRSLVRAGPDLLVRHGQMFWEQIFDVLVSDIVMALARMTDGKTVSSMETVSLQTIFSMLPQPHAGLGEELDEARTRAWQAVKPLRTYRDKQLAHRDRSVAEGMQVLPPLPLSQIDVAIAAVDDLIRPIQSRVFDSYNVGEVRMSHGVDMFLASMKRLEFFDKEVWPRRDELGLWDVYIKHLSTSSPIPSGS